MEELKSPYKKNSKTHEVYHLKKKYISQVRISFILTEAQIYFIPTITRLIISHGMPGHSAGVIAHQPLIKSNTSRPGRGLRR